MRRQTICTRMLHSYAKQKRYSSNRWILWKHLKCRLVCSCLLGLFLIVYSFIQGVGEVKSTWTTLFGHVLLAGIFTLRLHGQYKTGTVTIEKRPQRIHLVTCLGAGLPPPAPKFFLPKWSISQSTDGNWRTAINPLSLLFFIYGCLKFP